ncbi:hypothetical protein Tco_0229954 [Tanacetum coccineum]
MGRSTGLPGVEPIPRYDPIPRLLRSRGKNLFRKWEDNCSHEVEWMGDSLSSHFFAFPFKVKWKKRSRDASLVAPSARILSTMLRKGLMWS